MKLQLPCWPSASPGAESRRARMPFRHRALPYPTPLRKSEAIADLVSPETLKLEQRRVGLAQLFGGDVTHRTEHRAMLVIDLVNRRADRPALIGQANAHRTTV